MLANEPDMVTPGDSLSLCRWRELYACGAADDSDRNGIRTGQLCGWHAGCMPALWSGPFL